MIKLDFEFQTAYGKFADAIYLPDDHTCSDAEIQAMKQQRLDNWIAVITTPSTDVIEEVVEEPRE